jgi:transcriptional antiterminator NusG
MDKRWYIVRVQSGKELQARTAILNMMKLKQIEEHFGQIVVPTETVVEMRMGKKRKVDRKLLPGYVLVQMQMDENTWHSISEVASVQGFVGGSNEHPVPISDAEAEQILRRVQDGVDKPRPKVLFEPGELVRVIDGPFADFSATIEEVKYDKNRLKVAVLIFGRATLVDLDFSQVEKS